MPETGCLASVEAPESALPTAFAGPLGWHLHGCVPPLICISNVHVNVALRDQLTMMEADLSWDKHARLRGCCECVLGIHALCMVPHDLVKSNEAFTDSAGSFH